MRVLAEVIGAKETVLTVGGNPSIPELAALAADSAERSLLGENGQDLHWILYVPNGKGGFAPADRSEALADIEGRLAETTTGSPEQGFAGPGEEDGQNYEFRIRLFVPAPRPPPRPVDSGPLPISEDEEVIDLTDIGDATSDLVDVRRVRKKRRRKRNSEGTDPGRRRRRQAGSGEHPSYGSDSSPSLSELGPETSGDTAEGGSEPTFEENVSFREADLSPPIALDFSLTLGDGTIAPTDPDAGEPAAGGEDAETDVEAELQQESSDEAEETAEIEEEADELSTSPDDEDAETAAAIPAVSVPHQEPSESEAVAIGGESLDHEDVELSLTHEIPATSAQEEANTPAESLPDGASEQEEAEERDSEGAATESDTSPSEDVVEPEDDEDSTGDDEEDSTGDDEEDSKGDDEEAMETAIDARVARRSEPESESTSDEVETPETLPVPGVSETEPGEGTGTVVAISTSTAAAVPVKKKKKRRRKRKKPPPPKKSQGGLVVAALFGLAAACAGLAYLLYSRGLFG